MVNWRNHYYPKLFSNDRYDSGSLQLVRMISVLYVDDEETLLEIGKQYLERTKEFSVTTASSASAGLALLQSNGVQAIVSDYQMPEMDGIEFLKAIRARGDKTPFIIFTGKGREAVVIEALNSGADFYLQKGGEPKSQFAELMHKIRIAVERRSTERDLKDSREQLSEIIGFLPDATLAIDNDKRVIIWNHAIEEMTGIPASDMIGKGDGAYSVPFYEDARPLLMDLLFEPDHIIAQNYPDFQKEGDNLVIETFCPALYGGKGAYVAAKASPLRDSTGQIFGAIESIHDITERRQTEEALLESRERLEFAIEGAHLGLWDIDYTNLTIRHNRYWNEVLGYGPEETVRSVDWWRQTLHPDDLPMIDAASRDHVSKKTPVLDIEYRIRHKDGNWLWIHTTGKVVSRSADGKTLRMSGINQDITEHKKAEEALRDSERKFREIFNKVNDAIHLHEIGKDGRPGKFIDVNDVACERLQYSRDEMLQRGPLDFSTEYHSRPVEKILDELRTIGHATFETGHIRKDGTIIPVEINAHLITLFGGNVVLSVVRDITDRKKVEEALRESERKYRDFFETSRDAVFITSIDGKMVDVNESFIDMFGYDSREEILKVKVSEFYANPDERDKHIRTIAELGHTKEYPVNLRKKDGTIINTLISSVPWKDAGDKVIGFQGTIRDITERKRAEEKRERVTQEIHDLYNNAPCGYHSLDKDGIFLKINDTELSWLGYSPEEIIGRKKFTDLITEKSVDVFRKNYPVFKEQGWIHDLEFDMIKKDGTIMPVLLNSTAIKDQNGNFVMSRSTIFDITERKLADETLKFQNTLLSTQSESTIDGILVVDVPGKIISFNQKFVEIWEIPPDVIASRSDERALQSVLDKLVDPEEFLARVKHLYEHKDEKSREEIALRDGRILDRYSAPMIGTDGTYYGRVWYFRDITKRKQVEEDLHKMSTAIAEANKKLNLLSSITRHDILNQLTALQGYLQLSHDMVNDPKTLLSFIEKEEKAAAMIADQITFTREYQDLGVSAPVWQNVNESIKNAVVGLPMRAVRVEVDRTDLEIFADPLFDKVFYNLIDNALRYGGAGMKTLQVSSQESENGLTIVCENDGVGISDEEKKHLFTRGFGKHTGLGLFLTREILSITSITIAENGIPGKGARFEITVPKGGYRLADAGKK